MKLRSENVPAEFAQYLPIAERWGIGDDGYRDKQIRDADSPELEKLVHCLDGENGNALYKWLAGPESSGADSTPEYQALSCLSMAIDYAKLTLKKRFFTMK
jgi:hypothetical protein